MDAIVKNLGTATAVNAIAQGNSVIVEVGGSVRRILVSNLIKGLLPDVATNGFGYGVCATAGATAAKTVTITDFILTKNGIVSVLFNQAVPAGATLNVNSTGTKPIYYRGAAITKGVISGGTLAVLQYSGNSWNVIAREQGANIVPESDYLDMGLPSGLLWARKNIDITQPDGFTASEYQYECSFCSWGNTDMHNPASNSSFSYNWGSANENEPYYDGQVYGSTPGNALTADFGLSYDAARANLGAPWRMPKTGEFKELFDNCEFVDANGNIVTSATSVAGTDADKRVTVNGIVGLRLRSKINGATLFFPASGYGLGTSWYNRGAYGYYWSSSWNSARYARSLRFFPSGVYAQNAYDRYYGFSVRPVQ